MCKEEAPESVFASHSYHYIEDNKIKNRLVYNFEDMYVIIYLVNNLEI